MNFLLPSNSKSEAEPEGFQNISSKNCIRYSRAKRPQHTQTDKPHRQGCPLYQHLTYKINLDFLDRGEVLSNIFFIHLMLLAL